MKISIGILISLLLIGCSTKPHVVYEKEIIPCSIPIEFFEIDDINLSQTFHKGIEYTRRDLLLVLTQVVYNYDTCSLTLDNLKKRYGQADD